jgi:ABC-2 type transport system permease protein
VSTSTKSLRSAARFRPDPPMIAALRSELLKQRSITTTVGLFGVLVGLVVLVELMHVLGPAATDLQSAARQLEILRPAEIVGTLLAAVLGALSITGEIRHGTIRPTLLFDPHRGRMLRAKVGVSMLAGAGFGLTAGLLVIIVGVSALRARSIAVQLSARDYLLASFGGAAAGALWAAIGVGVGALVRNQVATLVGLCAWLLFLENLLLGDLARLNIGRYLPGSAAAALAGQKLESGTGALPAWVALIVLAAYTAGAVILGQRQTDRRDVA